MLSQMNIAMILIEIISDFWVKECNGICVRVCPWYFLLLSEWTAILESAAWSWNQLRVFIYSVTVLCCALGDCGLFNKATQSKIMTKYMHYLSSFQGISNEDFTRSDPTLDREEGHLPCLPLSLFPRGRGESVREMIPAQNPNKQTALDMNVIIPF